MPCILSSIPAMSSGRIDRLRRWFKRTYGASSYATALLFGAVAFGAIGLIALIVSLYRGEP